MMAPLPVACTWNCNGGAEARPGNRIYRLLIGPSGNGRNRNGRRRAERRLRRHVLYARAHHREDRAALLRLLTRRRILRRNRVGGHAVDRRLLRGVELQARFGRQRLSLARPTDPTKFGTATGCGPSETISVIRLACRTFVPALRLLIDDVVFRAVVEFAQRR